MVEPTILHPRKPCTICKRPSQPKFHPFCSQRCAQVDLNRWLGGHYVIPATVDDEPDDSSNGK